MWRIIKQIALFLPNVALLAAALARDPRVPGRTKVILAIAAAYFISPVDMIPDWIPLPGYLDDALVAVIVLDLIINSVDPDVVRHHWRRSPRALAIGAKLARWSCFFIPKRLRQGLLSARGGNSQRDCKHAVPENRQWPR